LAGAGERGYLAREPIEVGSDGVGGITLSLSPNVSLRGRARLEGTPDFRWSRSNVQLRPVEGPGAGGGNSIQADGAFFFRNLPPDVYSIQVAGAPEDAYLKSVKLGSLEVLETGIPLQRQSDFPLEVLFSPRGARVEGTVKRSDGTPVAGAQVVLVPEASKRRWRHLYRTAFTDADGNFLLRGAAPGTYKVFAWEEIDAGAWLAADVMAAVEDSGETVRLEESASARVELKPIPARPY